MSTDTDYAANLTRQDAETLLYLADVTDMQRARVGHLAKSGGLTAFDAELLVHRSRSLGDAEVAFARMWHPGRRVYAVGGVVAVSEPDGSCTVVHSREQATS